MNLRLINPFHMWAIALGGGLLSFLLLPSDRLFPISYVTNILLALAVLYWAFFFSSAIRVNRHLTHSVQKVDRLVTIGAYAFVRHPIYSSDIILAWAVALNFPSVAAFVAVLWITVVLRYWMTLEERGLEKKFGRAYAEYRKTVPMFLPKIWKV